MASTANPPIATEPDTTDRLIFTAFLAIAVHALLILGISFQSKLSSQPSPSLEITLATHSSLKEPDKADYLAQFNQAGSGSHNKSQEITTDQLSPLNSSRINQVDTPQVKAAQSQPSQPTKSVTTQGDSRFKAAKTEVTEQEEADIKGSDPEDTPLSSEIASLRAKLDKQRQAYAKRPRIETLTSVATKASADAEYLVKWTRKVEFVGNRNFPIEALDKGIFGSLRLMTTLHPNGTIESVEILQSSGYSVLDDAALQIVHLSSPFPPFPDEIRKDVDLLKIIRTWNFEISGLSTTSNPR